MKKIFYDKVQVDKRETGGYYSEKIEFILNETGSRQKVLDVGCNDGFIGEQIIKKENIVYGIDIVVDNLKIAKKRGLIVKSVDIENEKFPFEEDRFDVVVLGDVIEHIFDTDKLLRECRRVLKKRGKLIMTTPNVASFGRRLMLILGINPFLEFSTELTTNGLPSVGHIRYYTVGNLKKQLEYDGFTVEKIIGDGLNLLYFKIKFLGKIVPSLSYMIFCVAIK